MGAGLAAVEFAFDVFSGLTSANPVIHKGNAAFVFLRRFHLHKARSAVENYHLPRSLARSTPLEDFDVVCLAVAGPSQ